MARGGGGRCCLSMDLMRSEAEGRKMMKWGLSSGTPADFYYEVRSDCTEDVPKSKFKIKAGKMLSVRKWQAAFSPDGCLDIASVLSRIQRGGVHPTVRGEVWEFLLGCFDPRRTFDEREEIRQTS